MKLLRLSRIIKKIRELAILIERQSKQIEIQGEKLREINDDMQGNHHYKRNSLPSDDAAIQKNLIVSWRLSKEEVIGYKELLDSGFRVFSQNDEDGILLRIFSHIDTTNKYVVEIGSNCSGSDIGVPENMSTNLIVNHGWNASIFEIDETECSKMTHFYARHLSTKHFHCKKNGINSYYSPKVISDEINVENINLKMNEACVPSEADLMVIDIDGGDFSIINELTAVQPRVLVVEFEKRFRDRFSVIQTNKSDFGVNWAQSGAASLLAWETMLEEKNYILCAVCSAGFNALFIRKDVAAGKIRPLKSVDAFDLHPVFSSLSEDFWVEPDGTWENV